MSFPRDDVRAAVHRTHVPGTDSDRRGREPLADRGTWDEGLKGIRGGRDAIMLGTRTLL